MTFLLTFEIKTLPPEEATVSSPIFLHKLLFTINYLFENICL